MKSPKAPVSKVLCLDQVTERTTLSRRTIYNMMAAGEIPVEETFLVGFKRKKRVITEAWVNAFLEEQRELCF